MKEVLWNMSDAKETKEEDLNMKVLSLLPPTSFPNLSPPHETTTDSLQNPEEELTEFVDREREQAKETFPNAQTKYPDTPSYHSYASNPYPAGKDYAFTGSVNPHIPSHQQPHHLPAGTNFYLLPMQCVKKEKEELQELDMSAPGKPRGKNAGRGKGWRRGRGGLGTGSTGSVMSDISYTPSPAKKVKKNEDGAWRPSPKK